MSIFKRGAAAVAPEPTLGTRYLHELPRWTQFRLYVGEGERPVEGMVLRHSSGGTRVRVKTPEAVIKLLAGAEGVRPATFHETSWSPNTRVVPLRIPKVSFAKSKQENEEDEMARIGSAAPVAAEENPKMAKVTQLREASKAKKAAMSAETKEALRKQKATKPKNKCLCGCGSETGGKFAPGHDARYFGWMRKVVDGKLDAAELPKGLGVTTKADAKKILAQHGH